MKKNYFLKLRKRFNSGIFHNKGTRKTMEDAVICIQDLGISKYLSSSLFAVFDGYVSLFYLVLYIKNLKGMVVLNVLSFLNKSLRKYLNR